MPSKGHGTLPQGLPNECFLREKMGHETPVLSFLFSVFLVSLYRKTNKQGDCPGGEEVKRTRPDSCPGL